MVELEVDDWGEPHLVLSEIDRLTTVVERHFGQPSADSRDNLVKYIDHVDHAIRLLGHRYSSATLRRSGRTVTFGKNVSASEILQRELEAIERGDAWAYLKAVSEETALVRGLKDEAKEKLFRVAGIMLTLGDIALKALGPSLDAIQSRPDIWAVEKAVLTSAVAAASKRRRPPNEFYDRACGEFVDLWVYITDKRPTAPGNYRKMPLDAVGSMTGFVRDCLVIYSHIGLGLHAWPKGNRATWERVIYRLNNQ